jgi:cyanophycinase-like exopeptidase
VGPERTEDSPDGRLFISRFVADQRSEAPAAAYVGASNGDHPQYFDIFHAAMESIGVRERVIVRSEPGPAELDSLRRADIILLAGGDPRRGWRVMEKNGVRDAIAARYYEGAVLCGISAGAVQLGIGMPVEIDDGPPALLNTFRFVPCFIDVHDEEGRWGKLERTVASSGARCRGIGIPRGGGMIFDSEDNSIEPIRRPLEECSVIDRSVARRLLFPEPPSGMGSRADFDSDQGGTANGGNGELLQGLPRVGVSKIQRMERERR